MEVSPDAVLIRKADGENVPFDESKLRASLERSDATPQVVDGIVREVRQLLVDGMSTRTIYREAFKRLRSHSRHSAGRYRLKRALFELGPSGYPFEHFVGKLMEHQGFRAEVGVVKPGRCVSHEMDVWASDGQTLRIVECKFHSDAKRKSSIQTALYVQARFQDLMSNLSGPEAELNAVSYVVTNTRFTSEAAAYGRCVGMQLVGWDAPRTGCLKQWIDESGFHPLTCLSGLNRAEKHSLLDRGIVLCSELDVAQLKEAGVPEKKHQKVLSECASIVESR